MDASDVVVVPEVSFCWAPKVELKVMYGMVVLSIPDVEAGRHARQVAVVVVFAVCIATDVVAGAVLLAEVVLWVRVDWVVVPVVVSMVVLFVVVVVLLVVLVSTVVWVVVVGVVVLSSVSLKVAFIHANVAALENESVVIEVVVVVASRSATVWLLWVSFEMLIMFTARKLDQGLQLPELISSNT
uniref:Uncharacterized protein n=1 Tax=Alexandrium andersonii TaxID=327968 RepID=A0A7S2NKJ9_9DINO|mmetsp:Transcript_98206/g.220079  ORF Transcript_98206/g.220079 Transcript_98206/m.220079 type:complete len:185 (+) Transcript_98206:78-632(+)